jgi:lipoprotein NlpI
MRGNWRFFLVSCVAGILIIAAPGRAQTALYVVQCVDLRSEIEARIDACTAAIKSGSGTNLELVYGTRGNVWAAKGDFDRAIADYTEALKLGPKFARGYVNRGHAWAAKGDFDQAIADCTQAIKIDPKLAGAYNQRGGDWAAKGDLDRAIADYTEAINIDPKNAVVYINRGQANFFDGALPKALADLNKASELNPKYAYAILWLEIVGKRSHVPSRLADASKQIDMTKWPAPIIRLYLGQSTPEGVLAAADSPNLYTKKGQVCEANFFGGELALQQGATQEAVRLFHLAATDCPRSFREYWAATAELQNLGELR